MHPDRLTDVHRFTVLMGMDAFRIARGMQPRNFSPDQVRRWIAEMARTLAHRDTGAPHA